MQWQIPLFESDIGPDEIRAVTKVLESRWLTMGEITRQFEELFCAYVRCKHAFAVSNGTAALHLANMAAGIGQGDEVIVPSLTFSATVNSILYTGALPVFADVTSEDDFNISPEDIEQKITSRTKAIMVVHYGGYPCQMDRILKIADRHGLIVIEDAAHAPGANIQGRFCGTFGKSGCFSFFSNKNLATGEGGMVVTDDDQVAEKVRLLRSHGMTTLTLNRYEGHAYSYDVVDLGYNYRTSEMNAALGIVQLEKLSRKNQGRGDIVQHYRSRLSAIDEVSVPFTHCTGNSSYHIFPILLANHLNRMEFMRFMKERGIQTSIHYPPVHQFSYHRQRLREHGSLDRTEDIGSREVTLPLYPQMNETDVNNVVSSIKQFLKMHENI